MGRYYRYSGYGDREGTTLCSESGCLVDLWLTRKCILQSRSSLLFPVPPPFLDNHSKIPEKMCTYHSLWYLLSNIYPSPSPPLSLMFNYLLIFAMRLTNPTITPLLLPLIKLTTLKSWNSFYFFLYWVILFEDNAFKIILVTFLS